MNVGDVLGLATVAIALPLNWYVTIRLWRVARRLPKIPVLRERAIVALVLALIVTVFSMIFLNNDQELPPLDVAATRIITRIAVFLSIVPALYWLILYRGRL